EGTIRRVVGYITRERGLFIGGIAVSIVLAAVNVVPPLMGQFAIALTGGKPLPWMEHIPVLSSFLNANAPREMAEEMIRQRKVSQQFIVLIVGMGVFVIMRTVFDFFRGYLLTVLANRSGIAIRRDMVRALTHAPLSFFRGNKEGAIISRVQNDTQVVEGFVYSTLPSIINDPLMLMLTLGILFALSWKLTLVGLIVAPLLAYLITVIGKSIESLVHKVQSHMEDYTAVLQETIYGIEVVKIFSKEDDAHRSFVTSTGNYLRENRKAIFVLSLTRPTTEFIMIFSALGIIAFGAHLIFIKEIPFEFLWGFILFLLNIGQPIRGVSELFVNVKKAQAAGERVFEVVDLASERVDDADLKEITFRRGKVSFEKVCFGYPGNDEFRLGPVTLTVRPGEVAAFVGASGGGKSTLVNMIPKLIMPVSGRISIDGEDITGVRTRSVRSTIGMVGQENILFYGTIEDNIRYGAADVPHTDVIAAAKIAHAHDFILKLPKGYETIIGERGVTLSGGQRQRLALARAVIRKPKILILDEATSALDTESEQYIQIALDDIIHRQTTIVIAHRLSTVKRADRIYVMENGRVIESGTHAALIRRGGKYKYLYSLQFR
ncbi:MAG: ABC transporter ATP-binding protein, partial [Spirochaetota bacterium]